MMVFFQLEMHDMNIINSYEQHQHQHQPTNQLLMFCLYSFLCTLFCSVTNVVVVVVCFMLHVLDEAKCRARGGKGRITQYRTGHYNARDWTKLGIGQTYYTLED